MAYPNGYTCRRPVTIDCTKVGSQTTQYFDRIGWTATADSQYNNNYRPQRAVDSVYHWYFWSSNTDVGDHWIAVDMQQALTFNRVYFDLSGDANYILDYELYVSDNGTDWGSAIATGTFTGNTLQTIVVAEQTKRYIKLIKKTGTDNYGRCREIFVGHTDVRQNLTDFPLLLLITDTNLKTIANGGKITNDNGYDIAVYADEEGTTPLIWELGSYDGENGIVELYVKFETLDANTDTTIYLFYSNASITTFQSTPEEVWSNNYLAVYHFGSAGTLSILDSTSGDYDGSNSGVAASVGKLGGAGLFESGDYISGTGPDIATIAFTISAWFKPTDTNDSCVYSHGSQGETRKALHLEQSNATTFKYGMYFSDNSITVSSMTDAWQYFSASHTDGSIENVKQLWFNGVFSLVADSSGDFNPNTTFRIGEHAFDGGAPFVGRIDELRISSGIRELNWLETEYNNTYNSPDFFTLGEEEEDTSSLLKAFADNLNNLLDSIQILNDFPTGVTDDANNLQDAIEVNLGLCPNIVDNLDSWVDVAVPLTARYIHPLTTSVGDELNTLQDSQPVDAILTIFAGENVEIGLEDFLVYLTDELKFDFNTALEFASNLDSWLDEVSILAGIPLQAYDSGQYEWNDNLEVELDSAISVSDLFTLSDEISLTLNAFLISRSITDSLNNWADVITLAYQSGRNLDDYLAFHDAIKLFLTQSKGISDTFTLSDAVALSLLISQGSLGDDLNLAADVVELNMYGALSVNLTDSLNNWSDVISCDSEQSMTSYIRRYLNDVLR